MAAAEWAQTAPRSAETASGTYHLVAGQPVALLLDAGLGALAADRQRLHDEAVLDGEAQLPRRLLRVHAKHAAQVPAQVGEAA